MPGAAVKQQRRKATAKSLKSSKVTAPQKNALSSISSFGRVSKTVTQTDIKKASAHTNIKGATLEIQPLTPASRKRKVAATIEDDSSADELPKKSSCSTITTVNSTETTSQPAKRGPGRPSKKKARPEPAPKKRARSPSVSDSDASAIDAGTLFKKLRLESSPSRCSSPLTADTGITDSEFDADNDLTPKKGKAKQSNEPPREVLDLIDLHSSLLKTLTLHYAHNGSNVPADLRILCPNVARAWGKKKVTDGDIRICLGILSFASSSSATPLFSLVNYGRGKICIEIDASQQKSGRPLDEKKLNDVFRANVTSLWSEFAVSKNSQPDKSAFTTSLPKAPITLCASLVKAMPVLSKGQKRLEELKHGIALKKQEKEEAKKPQSQKDMPMANADAPKMSLLDRIRMKSLQKSLAPAGLTPAQLERRGALQRSAEVAALLGMLSRASSGGSGRISFTMAATLEKLKDSFRMGISRDEGAYCVRLLASEVAPDWIRVVTIAGRENVVIDADCQLSKADVENRVKAILEKN
ncbi:hypothetical protein F4819DRAFT_455272 [Hypoxylon fuscum]|nr:hypothetical protein F4819DRAFT_455272 [Hypoxylon fuscum]